MKCLNCQKEFEPRGRKLFCSTKCKSHIEYERNKDKYKANAKKWAKNNRDKVRKSNNKAVLKFRTEKRERFNQLIKNDYKRNKPKWYSRQITHQVLKLVREPVNIKKSCKLCGTRKNVSLKFEIYPNKYKEIKEAIKNKQIYYVCKGCRRKK